MNEIIEESTKPDRNLILLDGKIRELAESGKKSVPFLMKKIGGGTGQAQNVIFDLLMRIKGKEFLGNLIKIASDELVTVKIRRQALTELKKAGESVDEDFLRALERGEEVIGAVEKFSNVEGMLGKELNLSVIEAFHGLGEGLKVSIVRQLVDDYGGNIGVVVKLLGRETELDEKVVEMLAAKGTVEVGSLFTEILVKTTNKPLRRALKRNLYQMKTRGLDVVIPNGDDEGPPQLLKTEPSEVIAGLSGIDYLGERLVLLGKSVAGWGMIFFQITLSDIEGIRHFNAFEIKRKEIKKIFQKIAEGGVITLIEVGSQYCYFLIEEAYQVNLSKGIPLPGQFGEWKAELNEMKGDVKEPIVYGCGLLQGLSEAQRTHMEGKYATLLELGIFRNWFLEPRLVWTYVEKYRQAETSPLVLNPYQVEERIGSIVTDAAKRIFDDEYRRIYRRRLEEMAYMLYCEGDEVSAKCALCAAVDLGAGGLPSEGHGFLRELIKRSIHLYLEGEKAQQKDGLIVPPR